MLLTYIRKHTVYNLQRKINVVQLLVLVLISLLLLRFLVVYFNDFVLVDYLIRYFINNPRAMRNQLLAYNVLFNKQL